MDIVKMYVIALCVFLFFDVLWLGYVAVNIYKQEIGTLMLKNPNFLAAGIFYLLFLVGLVFFVIEPAVTKQSIEYAVMAGALFGLITYATYDLTNLATLKNWSFKVTVIDMTWGTFLSTMVSSITYYVYMYFK